jgi:hypothetical protein
MASPVEMKSVSTGDVDLDNRIAVGFILFAAVCVCDVASVFWAAYKDTTRTAGGRRRELLRKHQICLFLVLGVVTLLIVNGVKFGYQELKFASWSEMRAQLDHVKDAVDFKKSSRVAIKTFREMTNL